MSKRAEFCIEGAELLAKPYRYAASGLDNIFLLSGVTFSETAYGPMVTIENLNGLHRAIGLHIIEKAEQMTGAEFRFLRTQMELTQAELAKRMRVSDQTIANYEKGKTTDFGPADQLIRISYFLHVLPDDLRTKVAKTITTELAHPEHRKRIPDVPRLKIVQGWSERRDAA